MGVEEHRRHAPQSVGFGVITVSDSRTPEDDDTGHLLRVSLAKAGHKEAYYAVVKDRVQNVRNALWEALEAKELDLILLNGGTGISKRDVTLEAIEPLLEKTMPGFGEIFRQLSYQEIGGAAMLSRALAGTCRGKLVIALPGSPEASRLALDKLILPELGHLIWEVKR